MAFVMYLFWHKLLSKKKLNKQPNIYKIFIFLSFFIPSFSCVPSFAQFDGKLLAQLKSMKNEAAEFYYHCLEKNLNMNLVEILTFTEGLEKL